MPIMEFIIEHYRDGKDAAWIASRLPHIYGDETTDAMTMLIKELLTFLVGGQELIGFPNMRRKNEK